MAVGANSKLQIAATSPTASPNHSDNLGTSQQKEGSLDPQRHDESLAEKESKFVVTALDESDPKALPLLRKWIAVFVIGSASTCAACASSIVRGLSLKMTSLAEVVCSTHSQRQALKSPSMYRKRSLFSGFLSSSWAWARRTSYLCLDVTDILMK
jgi:hypothetical protein